MGARARRGVSRSASALVVLVVCLPACAQQGSVPAVTTTVDAVAEAITADFSTHVTDEEIRAIIVSVGGRTRFERYYADATANTTRSVFSVTKSVMATLVGQAIDEGKLALDDELATLLPAYAKDMSRRVARVTLRQLLTMTGGFPDTTDGLADQEMERSQDWVRHILAHQDSTPGTVFAYSDFGAHLLSPILEEATGQPVLDYARTHLFDPLGIPTTPAVQPVPLGAGEEAFEQAGFAWAADPQRHALGFTHLKIRPRDMALLGQLFLQQGRWGGKQIVPVDWIAEATTDHQSDPFISYGYLWWVGEIDGTPTYYAAGLGGQLIQVVPERQLVVVISTYVDLGTYRPLVAPDDLERLVTAIFQAVGA